MNSRILLSTILLSLYNMVCSAGLAAADGFPFSPRDEDDFPREILVSGGRFHVQGIAYDREKDCMYLSFTSVFLKTDMQGRVLSSVSGINGHLGALVFDPVSRKVFASLELKDDSIGRGISEGLGAKSYSRDESAFYVAVIDVDRLTEMDMDEAAVMKRVLLSDVCRDYRASVRLEDKLVEHRFACSGIDGVAIAPRPGSGEGKGRRYLYVAYGVYGDTSRSDNDYNILLAYPLERVLAVSRQDEPVLTRAVDRYFIHTGNTTWGVQNMAYDSENRRMLLAVYKGTKKNWPNYSLFSVNMKDKAFRASLKGIPYRNKGLQLPVSDAWHFPWGSTGICPLGDGLFYISEQGIKGGDNYSRIRLYREGNPFLEF